MKEIVSPANPLVKHFSQLSTKRSYREAQKRVLVEGKNLIHDLLKRHTPIQLIVTKNCLEQFSQFHGHTILISDAIAQKISSLEQPEGCFAEFALPQAKVTPNSSAIRKGLVLDRLADPGNVGTLLRTALGFQIDVVFLIEPCCDIYNPKTLRAAKGAQFDLSIIKTSYADLPRQLPIIVADTKGLYIHQYTPPERWLLVLGNEATGPSIPSTIPRTTVTIQTPGPIESLNVAVAGGIVLYQLQLN